MKLKVEYDKEKCIGQGNCASSNPENFELKGDKATLINSKNSGNDVYESIVECDKRAFKKAINAGLSCPVNAIKVTDVDRNKVLVSTKIDDNAKEVVASYDDEKDFVLDEGYFLIKVNKETKNIEVAFCKERNKISLKVVGKKPIEIYHTLINKENLPIRKDHAAYLGRELEKAHVALKHDLEYVQDEDLEINQ